MGYSHTDPATTDECCEKDPWVRLKHFHLCAKTTYQPPGTSGQVFQVTFCEEDVRRLHAKAGGDIPWMIFWDMVKTEGQVAGIAAWGIISGAQAALAELGHEQAIVSLRFCIRIGPIRICVEWLL